MRIGGCQLKLFGVSVRVRLVCGALLMALGYAPVIYDFCKSEGQENFEICEERVVQKQDDNILFAAFGKYQNEESLCNELLRKSISYVSLFPNVSEAPKTEGNRKVGVSSLKTVAKGEFSGAKIVKSKINSNFYTDARKLGVPASVVDTVIHTLSTKIDFRRSLRKGSEFEIVFDSKKGLLYSKITTAKKSAAIYAMADGKKTEYFFEDGTKSVAPTRSKNFGQPLYGRLSVSSRFGGRIHPIYRTYKFHTGVDLKANYGSPVLAIYDGVVTRASRYAGYGRCVDIKHASGYTSRYAHLSKCCVRVGEHVKKGKVIGGVGSSGLSTGAHLHLELARNNKFVNPLSVKMMPTENAVAKVKNRKAFNARKNYVKRLMTIAER